MARNVNELARRLGATVVGSIPDVGGGAFGAARLATIVASLQSRLEPGQGIRAGRPSNPEWVRHPKIPMSDATAKKLAAIAKRASTSDRKVSPMQMAAHLLEETLAGIADN